MPSKLHLFDQEKLEKTRFKVPERFTFPFHYQPHPLSRLASEELHLFLERQQKAFANQGHEDRGKMFGVLVVEDGQGVLGYLAAYSGQLVKHEAEAYFVPPVFDMYSEDSFFVKGSRHLGVLNQEIEALEKQKELQLAQEQLRSTKEAANLAIRNCKALIKAEKQKRKEQRAEAKARMALKEFEVFNEVLRKESIKQQYFLKDLIKDWNKKILAAEHALSSFTDKIKTRKQKRKAYSNQIQEQLFDQYRFLNIKGEWKNLKDIFHPMQAPSGAGECAAPKLLQYAFLHQLKPLALAEFWWGPSPTTEIRKHKNYYPSCRGKCEPILGHMLKGIKTDPNPMLSNMAIHRKMEKIYEDDHLLVINKPHGLLAVPGKRILDSVLWRIQKQYPKADGPLVVHRLDMATSGLMLIAKSKEIHKQLQQQFIKRSIQKRYSAILEGLPKEKEGLINLPLRVDLDNRPRQMVCYDYGKEAQTRWKVIATKKNKTYIHFFPISGRTHQLRVHAAHPLGLNCPILGDILYGKPQDRLYLHAEELVFQHPISKEQISLETNAPWEFDDLSY